ncbi:hypothetical protein [Streptomyces sp. NPDC056690]|uniref:hypothetical protein n=1 Tax=unclassified Streptomyces TaxID=2593676 RepID=UPI003638589E
MTPEQGPGCKLTGGRWYPEYDDVYVDETGKLDVDHRVPLAEAWDSGASSWTAAERQAYANDFDDDRALIAAPQSRPWSPSSDTSRKVAG